MCIQSVLDIFVNMNLLARVLGFMPIWYGIFFIGPLLAEISLRTSILSPVSKLISSLLPNIVYATIETLPVYGICMVIGGIYGIFAQVTGRWI